MSGLDKFNYEYEDQIDIFDLIRKPISITKPIRLIELFAGYGSQAMALRDIGAKFEWSSTSMRLLVTTRYMVLIFKQWILQKFTHLI